jgi:hypothetical protein
MSRLLLLWVAIALMGPVYGQLNKITSVKTAVAPRIDGVLDDAAWQNAPIATDFIQNFPVFGNPASSRTVVKILYDNSAIYIAAHLYDDPSQIRKQLTSRDDQQQKDVDYFSVFFDTYNDHQNGFQFLVTPNNVQTDAKLNASANAGFGDFGDKSWDAVWQSETKLVLDGWIVEMRIPYISLRFSKKDVQTWGLQFLRFTRRNNESAYWNPVNPNVNGFINQFGQFLDLQDIKPPLRLSFSPYVLTGVRFNPEGTRKPTEWLRNGGMDVKYGINESFTLDATLIPDFGQVVSDNVVNNLTPFEVQFQENRPFFTEGTELFNKAGLFYSRRVGAVPTGYQSIEMLTQNDPDVELLKNPATTQLYNAIKFSGRTRTKLGIGFFNAVTAPMHAIVRNRNTGKETEFETEPLTNYNIIVLDQAFKGRSSVTFTNTNVIRNGAAADANVSALDFNLFDQASTFNLRGTGRYSRIFSQSSYDGYTTSLRFGKVSGKVQYYAGSSITSERYNPRDLGYLERANQTVYGAGFSYNQYKPTKNFLSYNYRFAGSYERLYNPNVFSNINLTVTGFWYLKNFWDVSLTLAYLPDQHDYYVLGAPYTKFARRPAYGYASVNGSTDSRKRLFVSYNFLVANFFKSEGKNYHVIDLGVRYRFTSKFTLDLSHHREVEGDYIVYAGQENNGDPIIGFTDFKDFESVLSGTYNFTSRLSFMARARHYWSQVPFDKFANVDANGNAISRDFIPDMDENVNFFNLDAFLSWDFKLGCNLTLGYKNWLGNPYVVDGLSYKTYLSNFRKTFTGSHGNELTLRFIYFLDYNQLKKN